MSEVVQHSFITLDEKNGFAQIRSLQLRRKYVTEEGIYGKDGKFKFAYQKQVGEGAVNN